MLEKIRNPFSITWLQELQFENWILKRTLSLFICNWNCFPPVFASNFEWIAINVNYTKNKAFSISCVKVISREVQVVSKEFFELMIEHHKCSSKLSQTLNLRENSNMYHSIYPMYTVFNEHCTHSHITRETIRLFDLHFLHQIHLNLTQTLISIDTVLCLLN